jgi:hypothetical protein
MPELPPGPSPGRAAATTETSETGPRSGGQAVLGDIQATPLERPLPGSPQRHQVRCRAATGKHPLVSRGDAAQLSHPVQRHPLKGVEGLHRIPLAARRRRQPRRHSRSGRPGRDEAAPARLTHPRTIRDDYLSQICHDGPDPATSLRQRHVQAGQPARPCPCRVVTAVIPPELLDRRQYPLHRCRQLPKLSRITAVQRSCRHLGICVHHTPTPRGQTRPTRPPGQLMGWPATRPAPPSIWPPPWRGSHAAECRQITTPQSPHSYKPPTIASTSSRSRCAAGQIGQKRHWCHQRNLRGADQTTTAQREPTVPGRLVYRTALTVGRAGPVPCSQGGVARVSAASVSTTL